MYSTDDEGSIKALENKGITFSNKEFKNGQWIELADRERRVKRIKRTSDLETQITKMVNRPTKVKPGYKKKRKREIERS